MAKVKELVFDAEKELVIEATSCPYCNGLFGVDWTYLDQVDNYIHCPMCCMEIDMDRPDVKIVEE